MQDFSLSYLKVPVLSAAVAFSSSLLMYPVEVVATVVKSHVARKSALSAFRQVRADRGARSFYNGASTVFYEIFPPSVLYFFTYDALNQQLSRHFRRHDLGHKWVIPVVTSFSAEAVSLAILVPINTIQTRMKTGEARYQYKSTLDGLRSISRGEGLLRLYKASHLLLLYYMSFTTIQFSLYEWSKKAIMARSGDKNFGMAESVMATVVSTTIASGLTNPIDTLLVRYQVTDFTQKSNKELTASKLLLRDFRRHGLAAVNRGFFIKVFLDTCYSILYIPAYEFFRQRYHVELEI